MRSEGEIKEKIRLLTSVNWPEGAASGKLLGEYLKAYPVVDYGTLLNDLSETVKKAYWCLSGHSQSLGDAQYKIIEAITLVWMLGDGRFIKELEQIEFEIPAVKKLDAIRDRYEIVVSSEEEE